MFCQGFWSRRPSWPPSMSRCRWWRGRRTCWRSARTSWWPPSRPPAASGCPLRSTINLMLVSDSIPTRRSTSSLSPNSSGWSTLLPAGFRPDSVYSPANSGRESFFCNCKALHFSSLVCSGWTFSALSRGEQTRRRSNEYKGLCKSEIVDIYIFSET